MGTSKAGKDKLKVFVLDESFYDFLIGDKNKIFSKNKIGLFTLTLRGQFYQKI